MTTSAQLENEADATREQIAQTLDELRGRITPGHLVDQLADYARDGGGGMFLHNLRDQVVNNPMPVTLLGAGLAWLMVSSRKNGAVPRRAVATDRSTASEWGTGARSKASEWGDGARSTASEWSHGARSTASDLGERVGATGSRLQDAAAETASSITDSMSSAYDSATQGARRASDAVGNSASHLQQTAGAASRELMGFLQEQPLVLAGLGLAFGALLGAALPSTEAEDRLMGDASDAMKDDAARLTKDGLNKGQAVAEKAWKGAGQELDKQESDKQESDKREHESASKDAQSADRERSDDGAGAASLVPSDQDVASEYPEAAQRNPVHGSSQ